MPLASAETRFIQSDAQLLVPESDAAEPDVSIVILAMNNASRLPILSAGASKDCGRPVLKARS